MVNKVYLIDISISDVDFIKDICNGVSKEIYGDNAEIHFNSVNGKFAKTQLRIHSQKSSTFMVILSESVYILLKDEMKEYIDKPNIFIYKNSDDFMKDVMDRFDIKTEMGKSVPKPVQQVPVTLEKKSTVVTEPLETNSEGVLSIDFSAETEDKDYYKSLVNTLRSEKEVLYGTIEELKERLENNSVQNKSSSEVDLVICRNELAEAKEEIKQLKTDSISSKKVLETKIRECDKYKAEAENAKESYQKVSSESASLLERVKTLITERDELKTRCTEESAKCTKLEEDFMRTVADKDKEIEVLKTEKLAIQVSLDGKMNDIENIEGELNKYKEDNSSISNRLNNLQTELDIATTRNTTLELDMEKLQVNLDTSLENNKTLASSIETYKQSSENDKKAMEEYKKKYEECQVLIDSLKMECEVKEKENNSISSELSDLRRDLSENLNNRDREIANITEKNDEISRLKKEIDDLTNKIIVMGNKNEELSKKDSEISSLKIEVSEMRAQLTAKEAGVFSSLAQKVGIKSRIEDYLLDKDLLEYDSKLLSVFSANSDSILDSCRHLFNKVKNEKGKCLVIDFNYDTFLDDMLRLEKNKSVKNFHGYIDGIIEYEECTYKTKFENVSYVRLAKGFINENYLVSMNWNKLVSFIKEFDGKIFINAGVLSGSIKLLIYNTLCSLGTTQLVSKTTPVNIRSLLCLLSTLAVDKNLLCVCVAPKNGNFNRSLINKINQKYTIVDEESNLISL